MTCQHCESPRLSTQEMAPNFPHHAKVMCVPCGSFVRWLPRPAGPIPDHCLDASRPRTAPAALRGSPAQVKWAESVRSNLLRQAKAANKPRLGWMVQSIIDSTWFIANRDRTLDTIRWPSPSQLDLIPQETA